MISKPLTLSLVIPVYNEQHYIAACLEAIALQSVMPDEVIVVDNNSSDKTIEIAKRYKFVKVIREPRQHQAFAQKTGFNYASGDIIGRIDGDTILPVNWVKQIKVSFMSDRNLQALTGDGQPYDFYFKRTAAVVPRVYNILASKIAGQQILWGSNCAIRRSAWQAAQHKVLQRADIWEDYDLAFCLNGKVEFSKDLSIESSFRAVHKPFIKTVRYQFRAIRTLAYHKSAWRTVAFFTIWCSLFIAYPLALFDRLVFKLSDWGKDFKPVQSSSPLD